MGVARKSLQEVLLEKWEATCRDEMLRELPVDARANVSSLGLCVAKVLSVPDPIYLLRVARAVV